MIPCSGGGPARRRSPESRRGDALARFVLSARSVPSTPRTPRSVLVLARPGESEDLLADLAERADLCLLHVATAAAANLTVREMPVALVLACPEMPASAVDSVLANVDAIRPGTPVLAIRTRQAGEPAAWRERGVGVLRVPLLPGVLSRSVDLVLGMAGKLQKGNG